MPGVLSNAQPQPDDIAAMGSVPVRDLDAMNALADFGGMTRKALGAVQAFGRDNPGNLGGAGGEAGAPDLSGLDPTPRPAKLTPDEANNRFGIDGHLSFTQPVGEGAAAFQHNEAQRRIWQQDVLSRGDLNPLQEIGAGVTGALIDPMGLALMYAPELIGLRGAVAGGLAGRSAIEGGEAVVKAGRLGNIGRGAVTGSVEGLASGASYEAPNYGLRRYAGEDDYTLGQSLANVLLGAGLGGVFGGIGGVFERPHRVPRLVQDAPADTRVGAIATAIDDLVEDRPITAGGAIEAELARSRPTSDALRTLDESPGAPSLPGRYLDEATAVTTRGAEIPVRYAIVELDNLVTSHSNDLERNPAFPPELQPRSRERAGAQARNYQLESELNPKLLMKDTAAAGGAPIVSPDGVVESGNGRTIAVRRSAASNGEAYAKYRQELADQGFDTSGFDKPVLVRVRSQPMTGEARAGLARDMNADVTERMGATEQAMADAERINDGAIEAISDGTPDAEREFARRFAAGAGSDQVNTLVDASGRLSSSGRTRLNAALVAKAYGDPRLVEAVFESGDPNIKTIGQALTDAAPAWAKMRAMAARGEIPAELDLTNALRSAVDLVRQARDAGRTPAEVIAERLGQIELFGGEAISAETEAFLRLLFRDEAFKRQRGADRIAFALKDYARQASEVTPGPNLFGDTPDAAQGREILDQLARRFAGEAEPIDAPQLNLRGPGPDGERPQPIDLRPPSERRAEATGPGSQPGEVAGKFDFKSKFPEPLDIEGRSPAHEPGDLASARGIHEETATSLIEDYSTAQTIEEALAEGVDPATRRPLTGPKGEKRRADLLSEAADVRQGIAETLADYEGHFGPEARAEFEQHVQASVDAERAQGGKGEDVAPAKVDPVAADPALKAVADDTEALAAAHGLDLPASEPNADPATLAEAIRAAAICLATELEP